MSSNKKSKPIGKQALYNMVSCRAREIIDRLFELTHSSNENVALGASKTLMNKVLPDIESIELQKIYSLDITKQISEIRAKEKLASEKLAPSLQFMLEAKEAN